MSDINPEVEADAADRLIVFSDAVVAIAITLLALELPVPAGNTSHEFWTSVRHNDGHYLSFLISFGVVAAAWSQHHQVFRWARATDSRMRTYNMIWLLVIILIPFATKLLTSEGHDSNNTQAIRFGFYALLQVMASTTFLAMLHRMTSRELQIHEMPAQVVAAADTHSYAIIAGFGVSIPLFFLTREAWICWIAAPLGLRLVHLIRGRTAQPKVNE